MKMIERLGRKVEVLLLLIALPLLGVVLKNERLAQYLEFPPLTQYVEHAEFLWPVFLLGALGILDAVFPFEFRVLRWR